MRPSQFQGRRMYMRGAHAERQTGIMQRRLARLVKRVMRWERPEDGECSRMVLSRWWTAEVVDHNGMRAGRWRGEGRTEQGPRNYMQNTCRSGCILAGTLGTFLHLGTSLLQCTLLVPRHYWGACEPCWWGSRPRSGVSYHIISPT